MKKVVVLFVCVSFLVFTVGCASYPKSYKKLVTSRVARGMVARNNFTAKASSILSITGFLTAVNDFTMMQKYHRERVRYKHMSNTASLHPFDGETYLNMATSAERSGSKYLKTSFFRAVIAGLFYWNGSSCFKARREWKKKLDSFSLVYDDQPYLVFEIGF